MSIYMIGGIASMVIIETNIEQVGNIATDISTVNVGDDVHISVKFRSTDKKRVILPVISPVSWPGLIIALSNCGEDVDAKDIKMEIEMKFAPIFFPTPYAYLRVRIENKFFNFRLSLSKEEYNEIGKVFFSSDAATAGMEEPCFAIQKKFFDGGL